MKRRTQIPQILAAVGTRMSHAGRLIIQPSIALIAIMLMLNGIAVPSAAAGRLEAPLQQGAPPGPSRPEGPCGALNDRDFSTIPDAPSAILSTSIVTATTDQPEYCDIKGLIAPQIQFELRLPTASWNGRYLQVGCGGYCGSLQAGSECQVALGRNFAVGFDNTGHISGMGGSSNALWAWNEPQLRRDFGYRSEHVTALAAKAIMAAFYGRGPAYSYYQGCSNGGRQALQEAQRWPSDFDGIIAGAPAAIQAPLNGMYELWNGRVNQDAAGKAILTSDKLSLLHNAALAACDGADGLVDGQITDPRACSFDPATLRCPSATTTQNCLSDAQVTVVRQLYAGPADAQGRRLYPGNETIGSELGWQGWVVPAGNASSMAAGIGDGYLKYLAFEQSPSPSFSSKDWPFSVASFNSLRPLGEVYNATNPDLSAFRNRGGKLILYHGWADPAIPPQGTVTYYQAVQDTMGGLAAVQPFARLFMVPGMYHCGGGTGPSDFDLLTPIVAWVEQGVAPDKIIATQYAGSNQGGGFSDPTAGNSSSETVTRTRPLFPYPMQARYDGSGSIDDAANFVGVTPPELVDGHVDWAGNDLFYPAPAPEGAAQPLSVSPTSGSAGTALEFSGRGFAPKERVAAWFNLPNGTVRALPNNQIYAQADGQVHWSWTVPAGFPAGRYQLVAHGVTSGVEHVVGFTIP